MAKPKPNKPGILTHASYAMTDATMAGKTIRGVSLDVQNFSSNGPEGQLLVSDGSGGARWEVQGDGPRITRMTYLEPDKVHATVHVPNLSPATIDKVLNKCCLGGVTASYEKHELDLKGSAATVLEAISIATTKAFYAEVEPLPLTLDIDKLDCMATAGAMFHKFSDTDGVIIKKVTSLGFVDITSSGTINEADPANPETKWMQVVFTDVTDFITSIITDLELWCPLDGNRLIFVAAKYLHRLGFIHQMSKKDGKLIANYFRESVMNPEEPAEPKEAGNIIGVGLTYGAGITTSSPGLYITNHGI